MLKEEIRKKMLARREKLSKKLISQKSEKIRGNLFILPEIAAAKNIAVFLSFRSEVETRPIIEMLWKLKKKVLVPVMAGKTHFELAELNSFEGLAKNYVGVLEPAKKLIFPPGKVDLFILPGLAFDLQGNRIGFGKGFYDKFLSKHKITVPKIGVCFDFQLLKEIPSQKFDVKVSAIVSEKRVVRA